MDVVLFDGPTTVLSVSRRRTFTGAVRRAIQARDRLRWLHHQHERTHPDRPDDNDTADDQDIDDDETAS